MTITRKILLALLGVWGLYVSGYAYARLAVFHTVEHYPDGKGGARQDYIAKRDQPAGAGWEYQVFLPAIKLEETLVNARHRLVRG